MGLASLPTGSLKMAGYGGFQAFVVASRTGRGPGRCLTLGVGYLHGEDFPEGIRSHARDDQDPLAYHPPIHPDRLVAGVHKQVGVSLGFEPAVPPR